MNVEYVSEDVLKQIYDEINRLCPTDNDCILALQGNIPPQCNHCGVRFHQKITKRSFKCPSCKKITHLTAKTPQRHMKKPRAHLVAVMLLGNGIIFSAASLARLTNISDSSAQGIIKRYALALSPHLTWLPLKAQAERFAPVAVRRSKLTPAHQHPRAEYATEEKLQTGVNERQRKILDNLTEEGRIVFDLIGVSKTHFDTIFMRLQAEDMCIDTQNLTFILHTLIGSGLVERTGHDWFVRKVTSEATQVVSAKLEPAVQDNLYLIHKVFKGVSKKYMQLYLTLQWIVLDRQIWSVDALIYYLNESYFIPDREIEIYNSPDLLSMCAD